MKKRVLKAAGQLGYVPNPAGRNLRLQRTNAIGLFFHPSCAQLFRNVFYAEVMEGLEQHLAAAGYDLLLSGSDFNRGDGRAAALLTHRRVDAAIMLGAFPAKLIEQLHGNGVPLLLLDSSIEGLPADSVTTDGFNASRIVVDHLVSRGHREIVMLAYEMEDYNIDLRSRGFLAGLQHHGLPAGSALIRNFTYNVEGFPVLLQRLRSARPPTAVVCVNDNLAAYMTQHVREAGFRVPEDVSFVGFDDDVYSRESIPPLTTVAVDKPALGRIGAECLVRRLQDPAAPVALLRLPVHLVERESVATIARSG